MVSTGPQSTRLAPPFRSKNRTEARNSFSQQYPSRTRVLVSSVLNLTICSKFTKHFVWIRTMQTGFSFG